MKAGEAQRVKFMSLSEHWQCCSGATTAQTGFPLACLNIHHCSVVLFCEVFQQDHVVLFIGVVDEHCLGAHTQHLTGT